MSYKHFTPEERKCLQLLLSEGLSFRRIAEILNRSPSSVCREVNRNKAKFRPHHGSNNKYWYNSTRATWLYNRRRSTIVREALKPDTEVWDYIVAGLQNYWSPETIRGRWCKEFPDEKIPAVTTIYKYIRNQKFPKITAKTHLRRHNKRFLPRNACYNSIQPDRTILEWPKEILNRERIGDWEGDTVHGGIGKGLLVTFVDRKSRLVRIMLLSSRNAKETRKAIEKLLKGQPVRSISLDNGSEFAEFRELEKNLNTQVYFAEPHKPWQRGTNENTNDIVRFFFPKGFDFRTVTEEDIKYVEDLINNRPRKCLGWKTPNEVFAESVALD